LRPRTAANLRVRDSDRPALNQLKLTARHSNLTACFAADVSSPELIHPVEMTQSTSYLSTLPQHAIFGLPTDPSSSQPTTLPALSGPRKRLLLRGSDLILAVGNEIRIASLSDAKARFDSSSDQLGDDYDIGHYKTLKSTTLNFEIHQLVLNPTGKLLAVVGKNEVAVVVLPRKGWASAYGNQIECR